jgi:hypothetical protein
MMGAEEEEEAEGGEKGAALASSSWVICSETRKGTYFASQKPSLDLKASLVDEVARAHTRILIQYNSYLLNIIATVAT